jgi:hypothetical protein
MSSLRQTRLQSLRSLLPAALMTLPLLMAGLSADADAAQRSTLRAAANEHAPQRNVPRSHDSGAFTSNTTRTGANGAVSTRSSTGVLDKEAGTWTRSATRRDLMVRPAP